MLYLEASFGSCLYVTTDFLDIQPYDLGGLFMVSQEVSAPRVGCLGFPNWTFQAGLGLI